MDNERGLLLSYNIIFQRAGYEVRTAETTPAAIALLNKENFDLMLCDLSMEHENSGLQVLDSANRLAPGMPSVLMTGYSDESVPEEVLERGVSVIFKPIDIPRLLSTVDFLIRGKRTSLRKRA